jgi:hypothetical protein
MKEDDKNELEMNFILEQSLNLYIIYKLKRENLINEKEYYYLKEKIQNFKYMTTDMKKNSI